MKTKQERYKQINEQKKRTVKRIALEVPKDKYTEIKEHTLKTNESVNGFIKRAIDKTIVDDNNEEKNEE